MERPEPPDSRRAVRYHFGGAAEVADISSGKYIITEASEIGRFGCFVKTAAPFTSLGHHLR
jgi:hypothetical protein